MRKNLLPKERVIFENYDDNGYTDECIIEMLMENNEDLSKDDITDSMISDERYVELEFDWDNVKYELNNLFKGSSLLLSGNIGRWNGVSSGFQTFDDLDSLISFALEDCGYWKVYDENGHLYLCGSHHDGSVSYEIKILTEKGKEYLENYEYGSWNDKRTNADIHKALVNRYSRLPHYCHKVWGVKDREYEPQSKEKFQQMLNNQARSYYC